MANEVPCDASKRRGPPWLAETCKACDVDVKHNEGGFNEIRLHLFYTAFAADTEGSERFL